MTFINKYVRSEFILKYNLFIFDGQTSQQSIRPHRRPHYLQHLCDLMLKLCLHYVIVLLRCSTGAQNARILAVQCFLALAEIGHSSWPAKCTRETAQKENAQTLTSANHLS